MEDRSGTRERILDIALELFNDKGFDKTSLRDIAERLGHSKAAIYYHFASKEDILLALHLRLHEIGRSSLDRLESMPSGLDSWQALLDSIIDDILANRAIFVMHERNRAAFEHLHRKEHQAAHDDLETTFRRAVANPEMPLRDRVRLTCATGAVMSVLVLLGDTMEKVPSAELGAILRDALGDLLVPASGGHSPTGSPAT